MIDFRITCSSLYGWSCSIVRLATVLPGEREFWHLPVWLRQGYLIGAHLLRRLPLGGAAIAGTRCQADTRAARRSPHGTVYNYFVWWQCDRVLDRIHHALYVECREEAEREASPTAAIIDSQSVKSAEKGGPASTRTGSMRAS